MATEVRMTGVDELVQKLEGLKYDMRYKGGRFALRKAAQVFRNAVKQAAARVDDSETGRKIADNVAEKWNGRLYKTTGDLGFRVGINQGAVLPKRGETPNKASGGPTPHWRLLEFGTEKMQAKPFFRPAVNANLQAAADEFVRQYDKAIDRALRKKAKG